MSLGGEVFGRTSCVTQAAAEGATLLGCRCCVGRLPQTQPGFEGVSALVPGAPARIAGDAPY